MVFTLTHVTFQKPFRRTDSSDSNTSSLASFGLSMFTRNNSRKAQQFSKRMVDRTESGGEISRGFVLPPSSLATVTSPPASSGVEAIEVAEDQQPQTVAKRDEVAIVVGSRKNSMTKAVRYISIVLSLSLL